MDDAHITMSRRGAIASVVGLALAVGLPRVGAAQAAPEAVVEDLVSHIIELLQSDDLEGRAGIQRLAETIDQDTDLDRLGRLVLGRHWRRASEEQRSEYQTLFRELMLSKFVGHLGAFSGRDLGPAGDLFEVRGSRTLSSGDVIVKSVVRPPSRPPVDADWRLRETEEDGWVIIDLIVENVSLLISQRSEFASVIERGGIDGLLGEMRQRLARAAS